MHRDQIYGCTAHHTCLVPGNSRNSQILMFCILHHNLHSEFGAISPPAPSGLVQLFRHQKTLTEHHEGPGQLSSHVIRKCAADVGDIDHFGSRIIAVWLRHRSSRWRYTNASCGLDLQVISTSRNGIHTIHVHGQLFIFFIEANSSDICNGLEKSIQGDRQSGTGTVFLLIFTWTIMVENITKNYYLLRHLIETGIGLHLIIICCYNYLTVSYKCEFN